MDVALQQLRVYITNPGEPLAVGPVAYPPVFALLMLPFTLPPAPLGFGLWTLLNLAAVANLAPRGRGGARLDCTASRPDAACVVPRRQGADRRPTAQLGCAMAECYWAQRFGQEFRRGLSVSMLLLKPQYGLLIGAVLLWKRCLRAVAGVAMGDLAVLALSVLLVGPATMLTYGSPIVDNAPVGRRGGVQSRAR